MAQTPLGKVLAFHVSDAVIIKLTDFKDRDGWKVFLEAGRYAIRHNIDLLVIDLIGNGGGSVTLVSKSTDTTLQSVCHGNIVLPL